MGSNIVIRSYAPKFFQYIRELDELDENDLIPSLDPKANKHQIFMTNQGQKAGKGGASGSFFFFT